MQTKMLDSLFKRGFLLIDLQYKFFKKMRIFSLSKNKTVLPPVFIFVVVFLCLLIFIFESINGRLWMNDFKVYYLASDSLLHAKQVYGIPFGLSSGFYKYSPFVLLLFAPLTLLPYQIASYLYFFLIVFFVLANFAIASNLLKKYFFSNNIKHESWALAAAFVFILNLLYRELHLGNTNILLLFLLLLTIRLLLENRFFIAGILFSLVLLFKPFFLVVALPILLHKKWKITGGAAFFLIVQGLVLLLIFGWNNTYTLHFEWIKTIFGHSASFPSNNNIEYLVTHFITPDVSVFFTRYVLAASVGLYFILFWFLNFHKKTDYEKTGNSNFIFECFVLTAILPSILNTDTEHFLYALPIIVTITFFLFLQKNIFRSIVFFLLFILYGTNSNDIVGKPVADFYDRVGAVGISNLFLLVFIIIIYCRYIKKQIRE